MSEDNELDSNPFALALKFIMNYGDESKTVDQETHENLKEMLVSYLTQQQEYNDMKVDLEYYDEQLETILKNNKKFIDDTDYDKIEGDGEEKIIALKRVMGEIIENSGQGKARNPDDAMNANFEDRVEELEKQIRILNEELGEKDGNLNVVTEEKNQLDDMIKEMDFKIEEVNNELNKKIKKYEREIKEYQTNEKKYQEEMMELRTDCDHYRDLYDSYVKSVKDFKSDNSEKFKTMMQEHELLKREINDYKLREQDAEKKILQLKADVSKKGKLLTNVETREFILKQQLDTVQEQIEEEKTHMMNENEDLQVRIHEFENHVEELKSEIDSLKLNRRRRSTIEDHKDMTSLLTELQGFDEDHEAEETGDISSRPRRKTGKGDMLDNLNKLMNSKNKPIKKKSLASTVNKKELEEMNKKIGTYEKRIQSMTKLSGALQKKIKEEIKKVELNKKHLARKDQEIESLRQKLLETTMGYSEVINDINEQLDSSYELNRKLKRKLRHSKLGTRIGLFKNSVLNLIDQK